MIYFLRKHARELAARTDFTWLYLRNFRPAAQYRLHKPELSGVPARVADTLRRDGIAIVSADDLLGPQSLHANLVRAAHSLEFVSAPRLAELRRSYEGGGSDAQKPYSIVLEGGESPAKGVYTAFALQRRVLDVVNAYFGAFSVLTHCQVWHNFVAAAEPTQSQLWHRDPEDRHIVKLFLYLSDVDEGAGPFTYARGSHRRPNQVAPHRRRDGQTPRSTDDELAQIIPAVHWLAAYGSRGTMVFADTRGYHKGGWARRSERIVYVAQFLCGASEGIPTRDYHLGQLNPRIAELDTEPAPNAAAATSRTSAR